MCTFHRPDALLAKIFPVAGVLLGQSEQGLNRLLICRPLARNRPTAPVYHHVQSS